MPSGSLTDSLRETLALFDGAGTPRTTNEVAESLDLGRRSTYDRLERLADRGRLETKKVGASGRVWWRPPPSTDGDAAARDWPAAAESLIDDVLDDAEVGVFVLDEDFEVGWINEATERYFGLDRERVLGRDKRALVEERIATAVEDGASFADTVLATYDDNTYAERFECRVTADEGREARWLEHRSKPIESGAYAGGRVELYYDVSEQKRSERERRKDRRQFESLVETVEEYAIFTLDPDGRVRSWNSGAERIKGYAADDVLGEHVSTFYTAEDRAADVPGANLAAAAESGSVEDEGWRVRADGSRFWAKVTVTAVRDDGDLQGYVKITRDMTDRREREREIRRERNLLERVLDASPAGIGVFDADGEAQRVNGRFLELLGLDGDDPAAYALGDRPLLDADGEEIPYRDRPAPRALETGDSVGDRRVRVDEPEGQRRWLSVNAEPLEGDAGVVVTVTDVTRLEEQARRLERQRDELESELADVFERVDDAFYAVDDEMRFTYVNDRAEELLGRAESDLLGRTVWEAMSVADDDPIRERFETAMATQTPASFERYSEPVGIWETVRLYPSESGLSVYFTDITERKERERALDTSEQRYRTLVENFPNGAVALLDENLSHTIVGGRGFEPLDFDASDLEDKRPQDVYSGDTLEVIESNYRAALDGESNSFELGVQGRTFEFRTLPVTDEDGVFAALAMSQDVTERKRYERGLAALQKTSRKLLGATTDEAVSEIVVDTASNVLEVPGVVVYRYDDERDVLSPDSQSVDAGFVREELPEVPPDDGSITWHVFAGGEARYCDDVLESPYTQADADETEMRAGLFVPMGDHGILVVGSRERGAFDDNTRRLVELLATNAEAAYDRVERERDLEEASNRFRTLVEYLPSGAVALVDEEFRYATFGGTPEGETDLTRTDLEGRPVRDVLPPEIANVVVPRYEAALDGEASSFQDTIDGRIYQFHFVPVRDDDGEVFAAAAMSQDVTERTERERELERQREQLAALNNLNGVVRSITSAVADRSTRGEIERVVCEHLAATESYLFAWIGDVDPASQTVALRTEAGVEGYLDGITISADPDDERSMGPTGRAILQGEIQTTQDIRADPRHDPWRSHIEEYGFRSSAAVPIVHEDTVYGVLNVYAARPDAFEGEERTVIGQLGEVVGHAIAAAERKRALMSDEVVELQFRIRDVFDALGVDGASTGRITIDHAVPVEDDEYLVYGSATADAVDTVEALVEAVPHWVDVTFRTDGPEPNFELRLSEPPVLSAVASRGGYVDGAVIEDGDYRMNIHMAPESDVRRVIDAVQSAYPTAEMLKRRQITRRDATADRVRDALRTDLTDRQRATLEAAYHAGFFEWPRDASGEDVATSLRIAPATFHQHLRKAQGKVFSSVFSSSS